MFSPDGKPINPRPRFSTPVLLALYAVLDLAAYRWGMQFGIIGAVLVGLVIGPLQPFSTSATDEEKMRRLSPAQMILAAGVVVTLLTVGFGTILIALLQFLGLRSASFLVIPALSAHTVYCLSAGFWRMLVIQGKFGTVRNVDEDGGDAWDDAA